MATDNSCWACVHQQIGGDTFLGLCRWFEAQGQPKKPIPPDRVDVGCKFRTSRPTKETPDGH